MLFFYFFGFAEYSEVSASTLQLDEDPLLAAVSLLEANWISVLEIFELVNRVLTRIFVGLWPKKKANIPDLKNLAKAFDTNEDPILTMKGLSLKRGAEGAIAFAYSHGEEVNWEKVSSSPGHPRLELKPFFEKAKKICSWHCVNDFPFGGFRDWCGADFFDSGHKWFRASS
jgi:hypothetical protein